jgi:DeoR/GlpR family transcriptional regulator of sugar metabolism
MNIRQSKILELIEKNKRISISEIRDMFAVSEMTVRRDLALLEKNGLVTRVHGGVLAGQKLFFEQSFNEKEKEKVEEKRAIAEKALEMIRVGENIILDTGTTTLYIAKELVKSSFTVTVATTSLAVASILFNSHHDVLIFGGFLRREIPDLIGPLTEKNLLDFHADTLFMGCDGLVAEEGFYTSDLNISRIEETMVTRADRVIVVTDSSKFGHRSFVRYADTDRIHTIITDWKADSQQTDAFERQGVEVIVARL